MKTTAYLAPLVLLCAACQPSEPGQPGSDPTAAAPPAESGQDQYVENSTDYVAQGNEPFWRIATHGESIRYSSPEILEGVELPAKVEKTSKWQVYVAEFEGKEMTLKVRKGQCFDDMSGLEFSHKAEFSWNGGPWSGCARLEMEPQPTEKQR